MIELFSNFFISHINDCTYTHALFLSENNFDKVLQKSIQDYIRLKSVYITYENKADIKYFLSLFFYNIGKDKTLKGFYELMLMNNCETLI